MENATGVLDELARAVDGKIEEVGLLPDDSGFAIMSMPLPKDHWLTKDPEGFNVPPMPMRMGKGNPLRIPLEEALRAAGRYAMRSASNNGKIDDIDPDALIQNLLVGMFGYHTVDGFSSDDWANPTVSEDWINNPNEEVEDVTERSL